MIGGQREGSVAPKETEEAERRLEAATVDHGRTRGGRAVGSLLMVVLKLYYKYVSKI
jgi:hypothetical protein